eukprot:TRINITY_DN50540_c0_g1_i1.p1 TRINITY_DN50540_c0_g1~~TRINITY_DN50540_c0_g1_i1.p1  ORF type:complete len:100 (-),score=13.37 TRINITY_DN50540_c0_g1_i1:263-562(-)
MAKGSSMSGASTNVAKGGTGAAGAVSKTGNRPAGANTSRRPKSGKSTGGALMGQSGGGLLRFYTDDAPGLKVGPVTVLCASLIYISCVILLHIYGKLTR